MKTTLDLPDDLMRAVKIRAVNEGRRLKDVMADLIRTGLAQGTKSQGTSAQRVRLPLVKCAHPASLEEEMTPDRVAEVLLQEESTAASKPL